MMLFCFALHTFCRA